jgi:hypothetical protein
MYCITPYFLCLLVLMLLPLIALKKHYWYLRSKRPHVAMPTLSTFLHLPIPKMILSHAPADATQGLNTNSVFEELRTPTSLVYKFLDDNLDKWVESNRREFGQMVRVKNWKNRSEAKVHPAERLNARFRCKKCGKVGSGAKEDG